MKPAPRWPLHPAPREGEALSSWLNRVALCYHMEVSELLEHDLGHAQVDDLDTAPPLALLAMLSQRSGIEPDRLRCMSFAGWVPWLLDSLDDQIPDALETYTFQLSVLLPKLRRRTRSITSWRAGLRSQPLHRACPLCLNNPANQAGLLAWKLPLMLSCALHGCWLESYWGVPGRFLGWENADADQEHIPVLVVQMPSEPSVIRFYVALLAAMGAPLRPRPRLPEMEQLALALLRKVGVRMLVIDELHNVLAGNSVNRREFLNLLRFLGNELRIPLVGVGTRDAYLAIRSDDQLENRFEPMMLPVWEANDDCCSLLASFAASLPLRRPSPIATLDMARYLLTRSEGTIGELAHLLMAAAIVAVESGEEAINHRTLSMAVYTGPSERRRQFERELM